MHDSTHDQPISESLRARWAKWAFLVWHNAIYASDSIHALVDAIYDLKPAQSRMILRARIYSSHEPTMTERELVRVAAKRVSVWDEETERLFKISTTGDHTPTSTLPTTRTSPHIHFLECPPLAAPSPLPENFKIGQKMTDDQIEELLHVLIEKPQKHTALRSASTLNSSQPEKKYECDRPVSAVLINRDGALLDTSVNTNGRIRTRHAEMNLILNRLRTGLATQLSTQLTTELGTELTTEPHADRSALPLGSRLYVSLKPCAMCAAKIWESAEDLRDFQVIYLEDDPGKLARNTILTRGSPARQRFLGAEHEYFNLEIQSQLRLNSIL